MSEKFRREAIEKIPHGYYLLPSDENLDADDLIWDWTAGRFLRADSSLWHFNTFLIPREEIVCAIRQANIPKEFADAKKRTFTLKK